MNYPKMLYKGEAIYTDSAQLRDDLAAKKIQTVIVSDEDQEANRVEQGFGPLSALMKPQKRATLTLNKSDHAA